MRIHRGDRGALRATMTSAREQGYPAYPAPRGTLWLVNAPSSESWVEMIASIVAAIASVAAASHLYWADFKRWRHKRLAARGESSRIRSGRGAVEFRTLSSMAMGKRPAARQGSPLWVTTADLPTSDGHPFFERLNRVLEDCGFDSFVEGLCSAFYAARLGRPSLRPGRYFRMLLIGYFEGLSSERGIAWRVADSLSLRSFLDLDVTEPSPDHSTLSRDASADRRGDARGGFHVGSGAAG